MTYGTIFVHEGMRFRVTVTQKLKRYESTLDMYGFTSLANGVQKQGWVNLTSYWLDIPDIMLHKKYLLESLLCME